MTSPGDPEPKMADPPTRWYCNYCQDELKSFSVKCCKCPDFDLCLQCFSSGAEIGTHQRDDDYQIVDHALFEGSDWSVSEEYALLDGVETFGFGNWADAANHVGTKSQAEVTEHYNSTFILGNVGRVTIPDKLTSKVIDHTGPEEGPLSPSLSTTFTPVDITLADQSELGYMPHRDDFEREFDNDAETLVSHLAVTIEDDDLDISLKLAHVDIYTSRLKERLRRKKISRDYGLIVAACSSAKQKQAANKNKKQLSKHESDFREKLRPFSQFMTPRDQEELYENVQKEKRLRAKIKELLKYRRNGITKHEECAEYEAARFKREKRKESRKRLAEKAKGRVLSAKKEKEKLNKIESKEDTIKREKEREKEKEKERDKDDRELVEDEFKAIKSSPGFNFLSDREKKLCNSMKMRPARYITLKALIIKDHLLRKQGIPHKTRYPSNLDKTHRRRIFNYMTKSGWIKSS
ncbi:transcriptional adapter 2-beta-like isoform X1 [Amphiura filiformis]|uniref:transcriptional adapter 2-beta-like isoform X1 n=1 Tax=Amphiura filiformis TaxID=82378 RepID=UPI003B20FFCC